MGHDGVVPGPSAWLVLLRLQGQADRKLVLGLRKPPVPIEQGLQQINWRHMRHALFQRRDNPLELVADECASCSRVKPTEWHAEAG